MRLKGRHWLGLWLLLFLGAAALIVTRQRAAILTAGRLALLRDQRATLEGRKAELERQIGQAMSREVLVPRMERAGLHLPNDSENTRLTVDATPPTPHRSP